MRRVVLIAEGSPEVAFSEEKNLEGGHLAQPIVLSVYMGLRERGPLPTDGPAPRTAVELIELVALHLDGVKKVGRPI